MEFILAKPDYSIKEGNYLLKVINVISNEVNNKVTIVYQTEKGRKIYEYFSLTKGDGSPNPDGVRILTWTVQAILNDYDIERIELDNLMGRYITADLSNRKYTGNDGKEKIAIEVKNKRPTNETFEDKQEKSSIDVNDLLA